MTSAATPPDLPHGIHQTALQDVMRQVVTWRRHIHAHPDLSFEEEPTANFIAEELTKVDHADAEPILNIRRPIPNCVIIDLHGQRKGPTSNTIIALRADCDALPIQEHSGEPFSSTKAGVMHACGHDSHTASLMGAVVLLRQQVGRLCGTVRFIFQPAEETSPGGALQLIEHGCLDGVSFIFGIHMASFPTMPTGSVGIRDGVLLGSCDDFTITLSGRGGHASMPQMTVDLIALSAQLINGLQHLVTRQLPAIRAPVLTVAAIHSNTRGFNVIPSTVELKGTLRTMDPGVRADALDKMKSLATGMAEIAEAECLVKVDPGYPPTINHTSAFNISQEVLQEAFGEKQVLVLPDPHFPAEDFSYYGQVVPANFFFVGSYNEAKGCVHNLHNCNFRLDEDAMETAVRAHVGHIYHLLIHDDS